MLCSLALCSLVVGKYFPTYKQACYFVHVRFKYRVYFCGFSFGFGFLSPHFLFSRLIGLHISMCCDSVSFDFIKPATTVARFIQHSCLTYILILFLVEKYVTGNASGARAELGLVLNTCLDINYVLSLSSRWTEFIDCYHQ